MKFLRKYWPILLILSLALFLRVYNIKGTMTFLEDEGRDLLIVKRMLDTKRPVLIGPQTSTGNMYLGPLYYYIITPPLILANMDPVGPALFIALTGVATIAILYHLAKKWFGKTPSLISSALYAIFPMVVLFTRNSWNPNLVPFVVALILLVLDSLVLKKQSNSKKSWFSLGLLVGLLVQLHYMALIFVGFLGILILAAYHRSLKKLFPGLLYSLLGFVLILSPFILFEFRNGFVNTNAIKKLLVAADSHTFRYSLPFWLYRDKVISTSHTLFGNILSRSFFATDSLKTIFSTIFSLLSITTILLLRKSKSLFPRTLMILFLLFGPILGLGIYQENIHPHYLSFLFPLVPLVFAASFRVKYLKYLSLLFAASVLIWVTPTTISYINSGPTNQVNKARVVASHIASTAGSSPYNVISRGGTFTTPYQYFLALEDNSPVIKPANKVFLICQDSPCTDSNISTTLLFLSGPSHPTLTSYLGHPALNEFTSERVLLSNDHVEGGIWVAEIRIPGIIEP